MLIFKCYQMDPKKIKFPFSMMGKTWNHISYCWFFDLTFFRDYWVTNWNWKDFFLW
jgi:hypothetical protein